jgi:NADPH2:quinone reductase
MKAAVVRAYGPYVGIEVGDFPDPIPGPGEVVIDVEASEANFPDILHIEGRYQVKVPLPFVPGLGGVGRISAVGEGVKDFALGQKVLALPEHGTHAEKVKIRTEWCFPVPEDVPSDIAASLGLVYQTVWFALTARAKLRPGDRVLVLGATGGIGMAAVQLAKALGASQVIAATRGADGAARAREIGADDVVDTGAENLAESLRAGVQAATGGKGADVVIDPVGGAVGEAALRALAWEGHYVVVGFASGGIPVFKANYLLVKNISVSGLQWTDYRARDINRVQAAQARIFAFWREGKLTPRISKRLPLEGIIEALSELEAGRARGKIILMPKGAARETI